MDPLSYPHTPWLSLPHPSVTTSLTWQVLIATSCLGPQAWEQAHVTRAEHHPPEPHTQCAAHTPVTPQDGQPLVRWEAPSWNSDHPGL